MDLIDALRIWAPIIQAGAVVVAVGTVFLTYRQVKLRKEQATTQFEDELSREYRELARELPVKALLGDELSDEEFKEQFPDLYYYVDLSNEQVFLRFEERVSKETWENWQDGIESNLKRPAFRMAWNEIKDRSDTFQELRRLEQNDFQTDSAEWDQIEPE
jgi:hypothetical protein